MRRIIGSVLLCIAFVAASFAQEGMWLLNQLDKLDLQKRGLQISTTEIYSPGKTGLVNAVLQLGGGSASFVSPEGLIITNHHVAFGALQQVSSANTNYLHDGFLARSRDEEIKAPGYRAKVLVEMKDVTSEVLASAKAITEPGDRARKIASKIDEMTKAISKGKEDASATVAEMYNGKQYVLYTYKEFKDIRIVYSPPLAIGKYGGEIDNWMWPRHTGDFSFLRAYVSPEGVGKPYSPTNVPFKPKIWLKVAPTNLKDGDFTFVVGYPGQTTRYRDVNSANYNYSVNYPFTIRNFREVIAILDETSKNDPAGTLKVANIRSGLANVLKNYEGKVAGMKKIDYVQKRRDFEAAFKSWIDSDPARKTKYGDMFEKFTKLYTTLGATSERDNDYGLLAGLAGTPLSVAFQVYNLRKELEKPEGERQPGITEETVKEAAEGLDGTYANAYEPADKAMMVRALKMIGDLPQGQRISALDHIFADKAKSIGQFVDEAFRASKLSDPAYARGLFGKASKELEALHDPFVDIAAGTYGLGESLQKANILFGANVGELRRRYIEALYEWKGNDLYPDANSTIRFTAGPVKGYRPADAVWYSPVTTLQGVIEKNTGVEPFDAPQGLVDLYNRKDFGPWVDPRLKEVPVAFTHQVDITGGNSGSPVMNAKGELVGVIFDGNYEAMISDWQYDAELQRGISVDIHYVLFVTEKFGKAGFILDEMKVPH